MTQSAAAPTAAPACLKCDSRSVVKHAEIDGPPVLKCLSCGKEMEMTTPPTAPTRPIPTDWSAAARARYAELERQLATLDASRAELALLKRVLALAGEPPTRTHRAPRPPWSPEDEAALLRMVDEGVAPAEIAARFGRTVSAITSKLAELRRSRRRTSGDRAPSAAA